MIYTRADNFGDAYEIGAATAEEARDAAIEYLARSLWEVEDE